MSQQEEAHKATSMAELGMFSGKRQYRNFCDMQSVMPASHMTPSSRPYVFPSGETIELPDTFEFHGEEVSTVDFLDGTDTGGLLVLKDGEIVFENYWLTGGQTTPWISWSVAKSFTSALVGIAHSEGLIPDIDAPISDFVKVNPGSGFDGVSIKTCLQMSSGARWNEDYGDPESDINRFAAVMSGMGTLDDFVVQLEKENAPDTVCRYNSAETQVLGSLLVNVTGKSVTEYMQEKLCEPLGFESPGYWLVDNIGREMVLGGLNLTARDYAKLGELYRLGGKWQGEQIIPEAWVEASLTAESAHHQPGKVEIAEMSLDLGYGFQWWLPNGDCGEFSGVGIYNQFIYCDPSRGVVIVKQTANPVYATPNDDDYIESRCIELFRAIARSWD